MRVPLADPLVYQDWMEVIDSSVMRDVLELVEGYDYARYRDDDVARALRTDRLTTEDYAAILSPAATPFLEEMAGRATMLTRRHFGNSVAMFTPLYIANYCQNQCVYCGFNSGNRIKRGVLSQAEIVDELDHVAATGLKEILILTGDARRSSSLAFIGEAARLAAERFAVVGVEVYPLNTHEYAFLKDCGVDFVSVYQETYDLDTYQKVHLKGPKRIFPYRFDAPERALRGGMRGVSFGALLGLGDFRRDAFAAGLHAYLIQRKYPHAEISFSVPRLRPFVNHAGISPDVGEAQLLQVMLAYRLFMPFAGITISTRERSGFRDHVVGMAATRMSAGVCVGVGGHKNEEKGDEQFEIADPRSVGEVHHMLIARGLQPVYHDYVRL